MSALDSLPRFHLQKAFDPPPRKLPVRLFGAGPATKDLLLFGRCSLCNRWECWGQCQRLGTPNQEPQHKCNLSEDSGLSIRVDLALILRQHYAHQAQDGPSGPGKAEPNTQKPRQESRPVHQQPEGKEPKTPKQFGNNQSAAMQIEEQHSEGIPLRFFDDREEVGAADESQGSQ